MGESIAEGTIVRWIKQVGDQVDRDEPLFEISTDKVDAEVPSPAAGILTEITVKEGETVLVNSVVGTIAQAGETPSAPAGLLSPASADESPANGPAPPERPSPAYGQSAPAAGRGPTGDDRHPQKSSPLVRRIARENDVDITKITGSGIGGRVTKHDILAYLNRDSGSRTREASAREPIASSLPSDEPWAPSAPAHRPGERVDIQPLSAMRKKIAEHMVLSRRTSAHVHSVFQVNFSTVDRIRREKKDDYERLGAKLSYMGFIAKAVLDAIRRQPIVNASLDGDTVVFKKDINLGIAVGLESGLIVPVIRNADEKNVLGLCRAIADVADRARSKRLTPDDVHGGTFTITNPGQLGAQFGMPIINQPQVAILGVGTIEKRPVVVDDAIAIRTMGYLTLGYDHRLVDGAVADQFMSDVKAQLERFDPNQV